MKRGLLSVLLSGTMIAGILAGCGSASTSTSSNSTSTTSGTENSTSTESVASSENTSTESTSVSNGDVTKIEIGFENTLDEPVGQAVQHWADILKEESNGTMELELFANSALGSKSELIDQMVMGDPIITIADGAFYADYGVPDLGILYGPFLFDSWDEVWKLTESDWYKEKCNELAGKGLTVLASNWKYGDRELMTKTKVVTPADIKGKKIRLANSQIYVEGFNSLGATAVPMALSDVYTSLQNGTLDGVENPLSTLYGQSFQEVCKYILMTAHIRNFTTWCIGTSFLQSLPQEQQDLLFKTAEEAGVFNNDVQEKSEQDYHKKLEDAGVTFTELTDDQRQEWANAAQSFYKKGDEFGWSDGLYDEVKKAMQ